MMSKPNPERNKGARAERAAIRGIIRRRMEHSAPAVAEALAGLLDAIKAHSAETARRAGGTGRR